LTKNTNLLLLEIIVVNLGEYMKNVNYFVFFITLASSIAAQDSLPSLLKITRYEQRVARPVKRFLPKVLEEQRIFACERADFWSKQAEEDEDYLDSKESYIRKCSGLSESIVLLSNKNELNDISSKEMNSMLYSYETVFQIEQQEISWPELEWMRKNSRTLPKLLLKKDEAM
jgi:hypothetical protein